MLYNYLNYFMEIINNLPDDIILYIYTKIIKRYRFYKGKLIKLIDLNKYSFLEKHIGRRIKSFCKSYHTYSDNVNEITYKIQYSIPNEIEILNRKELYIDDDMICIELTENEKSLHYEILIFKLKRVENINSEKLPSIYYRGELVDYDWDMFTYSYTR